MTLSSDDLQPFLHVTAKNVCTKSMKPRNDMNYTLCHFLLKLLDLFLKMLIASGEVQRKRAHLGSNAEVVQGQ